MICGECGERQATVRYTEMRDGEFYSVRLCEDCAKRRGLGVGLSSFSGPLVNILMGLLEESLQGRAGGSEVEHGCDQCGMTYAEFRATGRLGCPACYESFRDELEPLLRRVHGSASHVGRRSSETALEASERRELSRLRAELSQAVEREDYERAADLRDEIRTRSDR